VAAKDVQNRRIEELARSLKELQDQQNRPNTTYASQEDLKQLVAKLQEIDRKRQDDNEHIIRELDKLAKTLRTAPSGLRTQPTAQTQTSVPPSDPPAKPANGFDYVVKENDTLNAIAKAYND